MFTRCEKCWEMSLINFKCSESTDITSLIPVSEIVCESLLACRMIAVMVVYLRACVGGFRHAVLTLKQLKFSRKLFMEFHWEKQVTAPAVMTLMSVLNTVKLMFTTCVYVVIKPDNSWCHSTNGYALFELYSFGWYILSFCFNVHFPGGSRLADTRIFPLWILLEPRLMEVVVTTGAIRRGKLQSGRHHQQTNTQCFTGRMSFLSPNQQCESTEGNWLVLLIPDGWVLLITAPKHVKRHCEKGESGPENKRNCLDSTGKQFAQCSYWSFVINVIPVVQRRVVKLCCT